MGIWVNRIQHALIKRMWAVGDSFYKVPFVVESFAFVYRCVGEFSETIVLKTYCHVGKIHEDVAGDDLKPYALKRHGHSSNVIVNKQRTVHLRF